MITNPSGTKRADENPKESNLRKIMPKISVVIAYSDHCVLEDVVKGYIYQTLEPKDFEVIVVDPTQLEDWSPALEKIRAIAPPDFSVRYEIVDRNSRSVANNLGVRLATSELIAFIGDDFIPEPGLLEAHLRFHEQFPEPEAVAIGPGLFPDHIKSMPFPYWLEQSGSLFGVRFTDPQLEIPKGYFYVGNASIKRSLLDQAGPFDEDIYFDAVDDYEMSLRLQRLGMRAQFVPDAIAVHEHNVTFAERLESMRRAGNSTAILDRKLEGPQPWDHLTSISPWRYRWKILTAWCRYATTRQQYYLHRYYERSMNAAFAQGYCRHKPAA